MTNSRAAHRYALSILSVAEESRLIDRVSGDFALIEQMIVSSHDFALFLRSPVINMMKKRKALEAILGGRVSELTLKFVDLLVSKERESALLEIIHQFYKLRDDRLGILDVTVKVAVPMTKSQENELLNRLREATKKQVRIHFVRDPGLKGGFTIQYEDTVWDASVRRQLESLRQRFAGELA